MTTPPGHCLITGATSGLGRALAIAFCSAGYHIVACARHRPPLDALLADLHSLGQASGIVCDIGQTDDLDRLRRVIDSLTNPLDVVVANAGQAIDGSFVNPKEPLERWRDMVLTNVFGTAATARQSLPALIRARGALFLIGSVVGRGIVPGDLYSVTKHAVSALAEALRLELRDKGVMVTVVQPGLMDTPLVSAGRRIMPMLRPEVVAAEVVRLSQQERNFDVSEIVFRPRSRSAGADTGDLPQ